MKKLNKWLSVLLCCVIALGMAPLTVFADDVVVDSIELTVNNFAVGNTWSEDNVITANSDNIIVQNAKLIHKGIESDHDIEVTDPLEAHKVGEADKSVYQLYLYIWTKAGYSFDTNELSNINVTVNVNGQTATVVDIRDGGDNGRSIVMDVDMPALHAFGDWTVTKEPTTTEKGEKERVCTIEECDHKETAEIPMIETPTDDSSDSSEFEYSDESSTPNTDNPNTDNPNTDNPNTGDHSLSVWVALLLAGGCSVVGATVYRRKATR